MSSRDAILAAVRANKPAAHQLPPWKTGDAQKPDVDRFINSAKEAGATVEILEAEDIGASIRTEYPNEAVIGSLVEEMVGNVLITSAIAVKDLAGLDLFICRAAFGVEENGAVWLPESSLGHRAAPFLAQHVVVLLSQEQTIPTMHDAYDLLGLGLEEQPGLAEGFGMFMAGPSKTADIEQSLVKGAHGPRSLRVILTSA